MARAKKRSRMILTAVTVLLVGGALAVAFWPQPTMVDMDLEEAIRKLGSE